MKDLSIRSPYYLCEALKSVNKEKNLLRRSPDANTLEIWIRSAGNLEPIIAEYAQQTRKRVRKAVTTKPRDGSAK